MKDVINYLFEVGNLERVKNSGWWLIGEDNANSVAEHVYRASVIAYALAKLEGHNPEKAASIALFHDMQEARINDLHKLGQRYVDLRTAEIDVLRDQLLNLPKELAESIKALFQNYAIGNIPEGVIAKDADLLEYGFRAKELMKRGNASAMDWLNNVNKLVKTETAKKLAKQLYDAEPHEWWKGLMKIER